MSRYALTALLIGLATPALAQNPAAASAPAPANSWRIDRGHSELTFSIRHMVSRVRGQFNNWSGTITGDLDDWESAVVDVTIDASSVDTNHERRDADLRGKDHFEVEKYPTIRFRSTKIERSGDRLRMIGDLTIRDVTRPVVLEGQLTGTAEERGRTRAGFEASTAINRKDFGLVWNRVVEAGGWLIGDDVKIDISVAAIK
ncbi:MAG TPA: YceI family protein [Longimicrobiales bacterium]|nr:YceI family protein [Longimicrobiales bacterium]